MSEVLALEMEGDQDTSNCDKRLDRLDRFYDDLYNKELSLKFSDEEVSDLYNAVVEFVNILVRAVGDKNPCLQISEAVSVGSAKEGTQLCSPCEYDFILILKELSQPGAISVTNGCPYGASYAHVKLECSQLEHNFKDIIKDGYIKSTQDYKNYIYRENGLRQKIRASLESATRENVSLEVSNASGKLRFKTTNIEPHGPAFMAMLSWQSNNNGEDMDITVDMCPAIRVSEQLERFVSPEKVTAQVYYEFAQMTGSVLLIPCRRGVTCYDGLCFKMAFTETELLLMENISEHHKKCYKILKYLINGRSSPSVANKNILSGVYYPFFNYPTEIHSYALKVLIWNHSFQCKSGDHTHLTSCIDQLFTQIWDILKFNEWWKSREECIQSMLPCPFDRYTSIWSKVDHPRFVEMKKKHVIKERFFALVASLEKVSRMDNYKFEDVEIVTLNNLSQQERINFITAHVTMAAIAILSL